MSANVSIQILNGLSGDPAVYVYLPQLGEAVLFDAGDLSALSNRDLLKVRTVCISHTHVDHFIGFDRLLRINVPHFRTLEVVGPQGIVQNICGKLASYTWNLLEPGQVNFIVHEVIDSSTVNSFYISNSNDFRPRPWTSPVTVDPAQIPLSHKRYALSAAVLDHGTPVCGFSLELPESQAVSKEALTSLGLRPGAWIGELQTKASENSLGGDLEVEPGRFVSAAKLALEILTKKRGEKISYITDIIFSKPNLVLLKTLLDCSDVLVCETNYRDEHRDRAFQKKHLTTKQAALIAACTNTKDLRIFHVSAIYGNTPEPSETESASFFNHFKTLSPVEIQEAVGQELKG